MVLWVEVDEMLLRIYRFMRRWCYAIGSFSCKLISAVWGYVAGRERLVRKF